MLGVVSGILLAGVCVCVWCGLGRVRVCLCTSIGTRGRRYASASDASTTRPKDATKAAVRPQMAAGSSTCWCMPSAAGPTCTASTTGSAAAVAVVAVARSKRSLRGRPGQAALKAKLNDSTGTSTPIGVQSVCS